MKAYIFPGQGAQFTGMGLDLFENSSNAKKLFEEANELLGFDITKIMFEGTPEELKETKVTQPAIFFAFNYISNSARQIFSTRYGSGTFFGRNFCFSC
jgi:malonyl CoA-acyl carrier protein transacylase